VLVECTDFSKTFDRELYCEQLVDVLKSLDLDLIVRAGFGHGGARRDQGVPGPDDQHPPGVASGVQGLATRCVTRRMPA
jgi:hypothetical protein